MIRILGDRNSLFNQFLAEIRDKDVQTDRLRFRRNLERVGEIFAYEISKELEYEEKAINTPLGIANGPVLKTQPILGTILRAGLPLHQGLLNYFDNADNAFITAYRKYEKDGSFDIKVEYVSCPPTDDRVIIMTDPMLATGSSMVLACKALKEKGNPKHIYIVSLIASNEGVDYIQKHLRTDNVTLIVGAIDDELTVKSYIVPGLGDAGDLAFGSKI